MQRRFVTCFRDVATHVIAVYRTHHSATQTVFVVPSLLLIIKHKQMCVLKAQQSFWQCTSVFTTTSPRFFWILLTQWNAGCKTLNNDHYVYTYYHRLSDLYVLLLYDTISVNFSHFFPIFMRGVKKILYELNSSDIIRSETLS